MRSRFAFLWLLLTAVIAGVAAYIAYGAGVATHITATAASGGAVYFHPFLPFFGFGFFFPILLIVLLFLFLRPRRWGPGRLGRLWDACRLSAGRRTAAHRAAAAGLAPRRARRGGHAPD